MDLEPIEGGKYLFNRPKSAIVLPVDFENLPKEILVEGNKLLLKSTFHVTLVCPNEIIKKYNLTIPDFENNVLEDFTEFVKENEIKVTKYTDFKFSFKEDKKSVIAMCEVTNLSKFFDILNEKFKLILEYPPTHVTLYTIDGRGIFLINQEDVNKFTKPISNPIGRNL